ncbi:MAG: bifunctional adenosylcobinamide kinase/adenosylcobinamide-phosphate guanylyltransferase [Candidatus Orphnella occulta]|nr:bifunctional adenosylcobinamide kinase/adenosylcobinamide-phosphate guanylyltransferase [Candidatus Orphnella occulta]MDP8297607.1 bifunctional adenosylcobinamide kinase/adenosylcobinamide-phosphate guanylyltransferase [Candidatus Orphnella occulta]
MKNFIFIIGGARSGKSRYAVERTKKMKEKTVFIATAECSDSEMHHRIKLHKRNRPKAWKVIEESRDVASVLTNLKADYKVILIDCLGLFIYNLLNDGLSEKHIILKIKKLIKAISGISCFTVLVSNDVGAGIVPAVASARKFRDILGIANQLMAKEADEVIFMQAGIPIKIK